VIIISTTYFRILNFCIQVTRIKLRLYYKLGYGINFRSDTKYVVELVKRVDRRVEIVDEDLLSIYERNREVFKLHLVLFLLVPLLYFVVVYDLWATAVGFLTGHYAQATKWFISTLLTIAGIPIILIAPFINAAMTLRDTKLINRAQELVSQGHKVLIVRGERHVDYIVGELRRRDVECEDLS